MTYFDVFVRTPEHDHVARSAYFSKSDSLGDDIRDRVFSAVPDATDYTFKEVTSKEVANRRVDAFAVKLAKMAVQYTSIQSRIDNTKGF